MIVEIVRDNLLITAKRRGEQSPSDLRGGVVEGRKPTRSSLETAARERAKWKRIDWDQTTRRAALLPFNPVVLAIEDQTDRCSRRDRLGTKLLKGGASSVLIGLDEIRAT